MRTNKWLHRLYSMLDFGGSKDADPTPGGIPFILLIAVVPILLALMVVAGLVYLVFYW